MTHERHERFIIYKDDGILNVTRFVGTLEAIEKKRLFMAKYYDDVVITEVVK